MKVKVSEATPPQLNWLVAKCEGYEDKDFCPHDKHFRDHDDKWFSPADDWSQGGPIIEREGINLDNYGKNPRWSAWTPAPDRESGEAQAYGPTPLIAAMRCYVASKLGEECDIPDELITGE